METSWKDRLASSSVRLPGMERTMPEVTRAILDGTGPFSPMQCQRLLDTAQKNLTLERRMDNVEFEWKEIKGANEKLDKFLASVHTRFEQLHGQILEEQHARERHQSLIQSEFKSEVHVLSEQQAVVGKRLDEFRLCTEDILQKIVRTSVVERLDAVDQQLREASSKSDKELALLREKADSRAEVDRLRDEQRKQLHDDFVSDLKDRIQGVQKALNDRVGSLESALTDLADKQVQELVGTDSKLQALQNQVTRDSQDLVNTHVKLEALQSQIAQETQAREAFRSHLVKHQDSLTQHTDARQSLQALMQERMSAIERTLDDVSQRHARDLDTLRNTHSQQLVSEAKVREGQNVSWAERVSHIEKSLADSVEKNSQQATAISAKLDNMRDDFQNRLAEEHCRREANFSDTTDHFTKEKEARDALHVLHSSLKDRVDYLENLLADASQKHSAQVKGLDATQQQMRQLSSRFEEDGRALELRASSVSERLEQLERLSERHDQHDRDALALQSKLEKLSSRVASHDAHTPALESLQRSNSELSKDRTELHALSAALSERVDTLEKSSGDAAEQHAEDIGRMHARLQKLHGLLGDERAARDAHIASVQAFIAREKEAREAHDLAHTERLDQLQDRVAKQAEKSAQELETQHTALQSRVGLVEQKIVDELQGLREQASTEKQVRLQHYESMVEHLASEKGARDALEQAIHHHLTREKQAREDHEQSVQELFALEQAARERHQEHVQELFVREREMRENGHTTERDCLEREKALREASHKELQTALCKDRNIREEHLSNQQELIKQERAARMELENHIAVEKAERLQHHETMYTRVDAIQRLLSTFEIWIRREIEERSSEAKLIWRAIESNMNDSNTVVGSNEYVDNTSGSAPWRRPQMDPRDGDGSASVAFATTSNRGATDGSLVLPVPTKQHQQQARPPFFVPPSPSAPSLEQPSPQMPLPSVAGLQPPTLIGPSSIERVPPPLMPSAAPGIVQAPPSFTRPSSSPQRLWASIPSVTAATMSSSDFTREPRRGAYVDANASAPSRFGRDHHLIADLPSH